jgi:EPS-associated MarR family transcriptional regulator
MAEIPIITEDTLDVMHLVQEDPKISQRLIAIKSGFSIGKVNYCLKALIDIGYIKLNNFSKSSSKSNYVYILTSKGMQEKISITKSFIIKKQQEFDKLTSYINK